MNGYFLISGRSFLPVPSVQGGLCLHLGANLVHPELQRFNAKEKQLQKSKKETQESTKEKKLGTGVAKSLFSLVHLKLLLCCLQLICLRKATSQEELRAGLDDSTFPKMHTAYFYHQRNQEPSICLKIARARRDGGPETKTSTHPM